MYAKSMIEFVSARAVERGWSKYLYGAPVVLALAVASLPFALKRDASGVQQAPLVEAPPTPVANSGSLQADGHVQPVARVESPKLIALPLDQRQRAVANFITRKYGVSSEVVQEFVRTAFAAGKQYGIDPLLVVAMMAVESSFNPIAESYAGAKGLMQIIPKYHLEKFAEFGGEHAVFDPRVNIVVGARIVREYLMMASGDLFTALQTYAGALADKQATYTHRVLNEKDQLDELAGLPKTDRTARLTDMGPLQPGGVPRIVIPAPLANGTPQTATQPASPQSSLSPGMAPPTAATPFVPPLSAPPLNFTLPRGAEEAAHTPPTQPQYPPAVLPQPLPQQPAQQTAPVNT